MTGHSEDGGGSRHTTVRPSQRRSNPKPQIEAPLLSPEQSCLACSWTSDPVFRVDSQEEAAALADGDLECLGTPQATSTNGRPSNE